MQIVRPLFTTFIRSALVAILTTAIAFAEDAKQSEMTFIACPIYRDTDAGRKSGCWLADDPRTGTRYDVSAAPMKPQLGHQVLVEGIVSNDADACGGKTLRPVRTSELTTTCASVMIAAEGYRGRRFALPADVLAPTWVARRLPPPPYRVSDFNIVFDLNSAFLIYQHAEIELEHAVLYAKASHARKVLVIGYAATQPLKVADTTLQETISLAKTRAEAVAESLRRLGVERSLIETSWSGEPPIVSLAAAPTAESSKRRVTIRVIPRGDQ